MPIDINLLRTDRGGEPQKFRDSQAKRFSDVDLVDKVIELDLKWKEAQNAYEMNKMTSNGLQAQIKTLMKTDKTKANEIIQSRKALVEKESALKMVADDLKRQVESSLSKIGNTVDPTVPISQNEDDNELVNTWGDRMMKVPEGEEWELQFHHDLLHQIDGYEPERGVGTSGHRAYYLKGMGVKLNLALIAYGNAFLEERKFTAIQPPYFMNKENMAGVAQLEDFDEQLYKVIGEDEKYLIATSEQPLCCYHKGEWLEESSLPRRYAGISTCFRKESGSHGRDTWGIFRVHQFDKVEQFCVTEPEKSPDMQLDMLKNSEDFYQSLGLPYRVVNLVSGELNNSAIKKFDLEGWFPGYAEYKELVSCSNCTDYQSRAMEIRCGIKKMNQTEKKYVHLLNSTLCATGRVICCILENYQQADGVRVPEVLQPYMGNTTFMPFVNEPKINMQALKMKKAAAKKK